MTLDEILSILKSDETLKNLLGITIRDPRIYEFNTKEKGNLIVYTFTTLTFDKIKCQHRFECNCISEDRDDSIAIANRVRELLTTIGDGKLTDSITKCGQNGGGSFKDEEVGIFKEKLIFTVVSKSL